jgi:hypothetical protein
MRTQRLTYFGAASLVAAFVKMLDGEGLEVQWSAPDEGRGLADPRQEVVLSVVTTLSVSATRVRIQLAGAKFESRFPGAAEIRQEAEDQDGL